MIISHTKIIFSFALMLSLSISSNGQIDGGTAQHTINANRISMTISNSGDLFKNGNYSIDGSEVSFIKSAGLWMGGYDAGDNLKVARSGTYYDDRSDFHPGPLRNDGTTNEERVRNWDRIFSVKKEDILSHQEAFNQANQSGIPYDLESIPDDIKYWPAKGNPYFTQKYGFELPDQYLAYFFDENRDGDYDPQKGDYPALAFRYHEEIPDKMAYFIINDNTQAHLSSGGTPIQAEIHYTIFQFDNPCLDKTTFVDKRMSNKAEGAINRTALGLHFDIDIGCSQDDKIGVLSEDDIFYYYNEKPLDENCTNSLGINSAPIISVSKVTFPRIPKVYQRDDQGNIWLDQNGFPLLEDPTSGSIDVDTIIESKIASFLPIYQDSFKQDNGLTEINMLYGKSSNGDVMTTGGSGFDGSSLDTTQIAFPGNPAEGSEWSMCSIPKIDWDANSLMSTENMTLQPNAINSILYAIDYLEDINLPCPDIENILQERQHFFKEWLFNPMYTKCEITSTTEVNNNESGLIYPNPTSNNVFFTKDRTNSKYIVYNLTGQIIKSGTVQSNSINIESLENGIYLLSIETSEGWISEKIVKM